MNHESSESDSENNPGATSNRPRTRSAESQRERLARTAKKAVNYKETRDYQRTLSIPPFRTNPFSRSILVNRSPPRQESSPLLTPEDAAGADGTEEGKFAIEEQGTSSRSPPELPPRTELVIKTEEPQDWLSSKIDVEPEVHLKTPLQAEKGVQFSGFDPEFSEFVDSKTPGISNPSENFTNELEFFGTRAIPRVISILPIEQPVKILSPIQPQVSIMAPLSNESYKILKQCPNVSSDDTRSEIREAVEKIRRLGRRIPGAEVADFMEAIAPNFDCEIREAIENHTGLDTIDQVCDFIVQKYVIKGNFEQRYKELGDLKKKGSETYAEFGKRIIKFKNDLIKLASYQADADSLAGRTTVIEQRALNTYTRALRKHLALVYKHGQPKNVMEAQRFVELAENELDFSDDESVTEPKLERKVSSTKELKKSPVCQQCEQESHEALFCPFTPCLYCQSTSHKSSDCEEIEQEAKINTICKGCRSIHHTIDFCPKRADDESYCQICQAANVHTAQSCDVARRLTNQLKEATDALNNLSVSQFDRNPRGEAVRNPSNSGCHLCKDSRHFVRQCPLALKYFRGRWRGRFQNSRGWHNQNGGFRRNQQGQGQNSYAQNQPPNNGFNSNYRGRGNPGNRGFRGNFRGRGNYQNQGGNHGNYNRNYNDGYSEHYNNGNYNGGNYNNNYNNNNNNYGNANNGGGRNQSYNANPFIEIGPSNRNNPFLQWDPRSAGATAPNPGSLFYWPPLVNPSVSPGIFNVQNPRPAVPQVTFPDQKNT